MRAAVQRELDALREDVRKIQEQLDRPAPPAFHTPGEEIRNARLYWAALAARDGGDFKALERFFDPPPKGMGGWIPPEEYRNRYC